MKLQFPRPKDQSGLRRKAAVIRGRLLEDSKKKTKQAERMLGNAASVSSSAKKKGKEAELLAKDSAKVRDTDVTTMASLPSGPVGELSCKSCPCMPAPFPGCSAEYPTLTKGSVGPRL